MFIQKLTFIACYNYFIILTHLMLILQHLLNISTLFHNFVVEQLFPLFNYYIETYFIH